MRNWLLLLGSTLALLGCKTVEIENGEVPAEYLSQAKQLEGVYQGSFVGVRGELRITFEGNKPILEMQKLDGSDLYKPACQSKINNLKWVSLDNDKKVDGASFYFDPGNCFIDGREIQLSFSDDYRKIHVSILERRITERQCRWEVADPRLGPREYCEYVQKDLTSRGSFKR